MPCFLSCGSLSFPTWLTLLLQSSKQSPRLCHLMHILASPWPHFDLSQNGMLPIKAPAKFERQLSSGMSALVCAETKALLMVNVIVTRRDLFVAFGAFVLLLLHEALQCGV